MNISSEDNSVILLFENGEEILSVIDERLVELIKGNAAHAFDVSIIRNEDCLSVALIARDFDLLTEHLKGLEEKEALDILFEYARFAESDNNAETYYLEPDSIFYDKYGLRFIKAISTLNQSKQELIISFIERLSELVGNFDSELKEILIAKCKSAESFEEALRESVDNYFNPVIIEPATEQISDSPFAPQSEAENETGAAPKILKRCSSCGAEYEEAFVFCIKCGGKLVDVEEPSAPQPEPQPEPMPVWQPTPQPEPQPEPQPVWQPTPQPEPQPAWQPTPQPEPQPEPMPAPQPAPQPVEIPQQSPPSSEENKKLFRETTLLGFTNYGETSILGGGGVGASFDTPNLVRQTNNEKIFITKRSFVIGKSSEKADYAVTNNNAISRVHAEISVVGSDYFIVDRNSTNHTYVNNTYVQPESPVQIHDGDEIKLANEIFTFHLQ